MGRILGHFCYPLFSMPMGVMVLLSASLLVPSPAWTAGELSQGFVYQGRLTDVSGTSPLLDTVDLTVGIFDSSGTCLLYEETQSGIDLTATNGLFAIQVGSSVGDAKRTARDPGLSFAQVFQNSMLIRAAGAANCAAGYTPASGDIRKLAFTVAPRHGVTETLPEQVIGSVPQATVAETLQGKVPLDFVQVTGNATPFSVTKLNLDLLFGTGGGGVVDATSLHNHDSAYVKIGSGSNVNLGSAVSYTTGSVGIGTSATGSYDFLIQKSAPAMELSSTGAGSQALKIDFYSTNASTQRASIQSQADQNILKFYTGSTQALQLNSDQSATFSGSITTAKTLGLGKYTDAQETTLVTALTASGTGVAGTLWANVETPTASVLKYWDGSSVQLVGSGAGGGISGLTAGRIPLSASATTISDSANLTFNSATGAMTMGGTAPSITSGDAITIAAGGANKNVVLTPSGTGYAVLNGNVGVGTSTPGVKLDVNGLTRIYDQTAVTGITTATVRAGAGQTTTNLVEIQNNAGTVLSKIDSGGFFYQPSAPTAATLQAATTNYVDSAVSTAGGNYLKKDGSVALTSSWSAGQAITATTLTSTANGPALIASGAPAASATSSLLQLGPVIAGGSANGTYIGANPAAFTGNFIDLQVGGASKFKVDKDGKITGDGSGLTNVPSEISGLTAGRIPLSASATTISDSANLTFNSATGAMTMGGTAPSITSGDAITIAAGGANKNVVLTPSGTGYTLLNGKVGLGTAGPTNLLEVNGTFKAVGQTILADAYRFYSGASDGSAAYTDFRTNPATGNGIISAKTASLFFNYDHGNAGTFWSNGSTLSYAYMSSTGQLTLNHNAVLGTNSIPATRNTLDAFGGVAIGSYANANLAPANGMIVSGNVGIGTTSPQSELQVNGYVQLALTTGAPAATDCDAAAERGRMKVDNVNGLLYICMDSGWVSK